MPVRYDGEMVAEDRRGVAQNFISVAVGDGALLWRPVGVAQKTGPPADRDGIDRRRPAFLPGWIVL